MTKKKDKLQKLKDAKSVRVNAFASCARCGNNHDFPIEFKKLIRAHREFTHWAPCPINGQPILLKYEYVDDSKKHS